MDITILIASVIAASPPILFAVLGETITEKAGVINLSIDGSILMTAMVGFMVALKTNSLIAGFVSAMVVGAFISSIIAFVNLTLRQPQVATGFILTLLCRDLAYVLGNPYAHVPGLHIPHTPIPGLVHLSMVGPILFNQNLIVYLSLLSIIAVWFYMFKTQPGLKLQGLGENPAAAFARGVNVTRMRYVYTIVGGGLIGLGGASFSLLVKPGWARPYGIEGTGWIVLAIVIFGGWKPIRAVAGAYLFVALQTAVNILQSAMPNVPTQLFPTLPFPLMIFTLLLVAVGKAEWMDRVLRHLPEGVRRTFVQIIRLLQTSPPTALGTSFEKE